MSPPKPFEVAIVGGGITGVILAVALTARGIPCAIYEQAPRFREIGAGLGIHPGAVRALAVIGRDTVLAAFERVRTLNADPAKRHVWFDVRDGRGGGASAAEGEGAPPLFSIVGSVEGVEPTTAVHRARFLDELVALLPPGLAYFGKRLEGIEDERRGPAGKMVLHFADGTAAAADAVLGCDGVKSRTREILVGGADKPGAKCSYSHKYAYRGLIPMQEAAAAIGADKAENASLWMADGRHVLTFPVDHGKTLNLVAFATDTQDWPSDTHLTLPATREEALEDFQDCSSDIRQLLRMTQNNPDRWGLFDLADHPLPRFYRGHLCLVGDAAHATTPHHGAGAGFCVEDVAVLASLLDATDGDRGGERLVRSADDLETVFAVFDASRRERDQWLVRSSRRAADVYELRDAVLGDDFEAIRRDIQARQAHIWNVDLDGMIEEARRDLRRRLAASRR